MVYLSGEESDVKAHKSFHNFFQKGIRFQVWWTVFFILE